MSRSSSSQCELHTGLPRAVGAREGGRRVGPSLPMDAKDARPSHMVDRRRCLEADREIPGDWPVGQSDLGGRVVRHVLCVLGVGLGDFR